MRLRGRKELVKGRPGIGRAVDGLILLDLIYLLQRKRDQIGQALCLDTNYCTMVNRLCVKVEKAVCRAITALVIHIHLNRKM